MNKSTTRASLFELNGVPDLKQATPLAFQHVVAMIVGCVTPPIIVSGVAGLSEQDSIILIQAELVRRIYHTGDRNFIEPLWKGNLETGVDPDRYDLWLCRCSVLWHG